MEGQEMVKWEVKRRAKRGSRGEVFLDVASTYLASAASHDIHFPLTDGKPPVK
jgi:hypothetical protein